MSLLKQAILFSVLLFSAGSVLAGVQLVEPLDHLFEDLNSGPLDLGKVAQGESFSVIIAPKAFITFHEWFKATPREVSDCLRVERPDTPSTNLEFIIGVGQGCEPGRKSVSFVLEEFGHDILSHKITLGFDVRKPGELLRASFSDTVREAKVGEELEYEVVVVNNSFAEHRVVLGSSLPQTYLRNKEVVVPGKSSVQETLKVTPLVYGNERFSFYARSALTGEEVFSSRGSLKVYPTLKGKYFPGANGLSVFTVSLAPLYYLIGLVFSLF